MDGQVHEIRIEGKVATSHGISHKEFKRLAEKALIALPGEFQRYLENVAVVIEDEPPDYMPEVMGLYEVSPWWNAQWTITSCPIASLFIKGQLNAPVLHMLR